MFAASGLPGPAEQAERIVNAGLDCLICHAGEYHAVPSGNLAAVADHATGNASPVAAGFPRAARDDGDFDHDGIPDPVIDTDGDGEPDAPLMVDTDGDGKPDASWPTIAQVRDPSAVLSVGPTSERACLRCHEHGLSGYKRGTPFDAKHDVHAATTSRPLRGRQ